MILVTGGTGTLGRELVPRLQAAGESVRVLTRDAARASTLPPGVEVALGDLRDTSSVTAAVHGCKAVISAAHGFIGPGKPTPEAVDREGNRRLIRAAVSAKVGRFVLMSVVGAGPHHPMSLARAKFASEQELRASGLRFAIVRAMPFMETWLAVMADMLDAKGHALVFGSGANPISFVSVRDVAALVVQCVQGAAPSELYEIGGPEALGLATLAQRLLEARGRLASVQHIPLFVLRSLSLLARPFSPGFARQARAAVVMNTTDMTLDPARCPQVCVTGLAEVLGAPASRGH